MISHDLELLDEAILGCSTSTGLYEIGTGHLVEYQRHPQVLAGPGKADEERLARRRCPGQGDRPPRRTSSTASSAKATKAADGRTACEKRIARLRGRQGRRRPARAARCRCSFPDPPPRGRHRHRGRAGCRKAYGGPSVFEDVTFDLGRGERLLVLGLNGAGKTSLLGILAGETDGHSRHLPVRPPRQRRLLRPGARQPARRPRRCSTTSATRCRPASMLTETQLRGLLLGMMGLSGEKVFQASGTLSGGEKTKLALAMLMAGRNNLLLLDEPTNNLDPASRESVADSLSSWKGSMILVSHDTEFVAGAAADQGVAAA